MSLQKVQMTTLDEFLMNHPSPYKNLNKIYRQITFSCKVISNRIKRAGLENLYGSTSITNFHGEEVKNLDVLANNTFITSLSKIKDVGALVSEEDYDAMIINEAGRYIVTFDPLDGSSNIDANVNIGSIFGVFERTGDGKMTKNDCLQPGRNLITAGYCLYGSSTILVIAYNGQVTGFTLDENYGEFVLTHNKMTVPEFKPIYSVNEGNRDSWDPKVREFVDSLKSTEGGKKPFSLRYIGSMVADIHRTLLYGGLFMYPASDSAPQGKLRYLYEVAPMSLIMETAGGRAVCGEVPALDIVPETVHQRVPVFMGSSGCIKKFEI